jgi:hypothetical protein
MRQGALVARVFIVAVAMLCASRVDGQARLMGVVRDSTGAAVAGAEVSAQGTSRTALTDANGAFLLTGIAPGTSVVTVRRIGYAPSSTLMRLVEGENNLGDIVLIAIARELDTVSTREQQILREYPLLREFEENRRIGLGQFVTRAMLAQHQGGFITPVFNQMRGLQIVRSATVASNAWVASIGTASTSCTILEGRLDGEQISPRRDADCNYCYPTVFLDRSRLAPQGVAANVGRFHPDMLQAIEVYTGGAGTPVRYMDSQSGCGVIVFHTRVPEVRPRAIGMRQAGPTRSRILANASISAGRPGADCIRCGSGQAQDVTLGYTLRDRWVISGRYAEWGAEHGGSQDFTLKQLLVEWYPTPEPGRIKWFVNAGVGQTSVDASTSNPPESSDRLVATNLPSFVVGTGIDITVYRRFVLTPFVSHTRTVGGMTNQHHCVYDFDITGELLSSCGSITGPHRFNLSQIGARFGWR